MRHDPPQVWHRTSNLHDQIPGVDLTQNFATLCRQSGQMRLSATHGEHSLSWKFESGVMPAIRGVMIQWRQDNRRVAHPDGNQPTITRNMIESISAEVSKAIVETQWDTSVVSPAIDSPQAISESGQLPW